MIATLTWNPSLDYVVTVHGFRQGRTNRTEEEQIFPGGKGINVSLVLRQLGVESIPLGFAAGFTGEEIVRLTRKLGLSPEFITVPGGYSRINVKWKNQDGTELNGVGPVIGEAQKMQLYEKLDRLKAGDVLVLAGSVSRGVTENGYGDIMGRLEGRGIRFVVDASGDLLRRTLAFHPFLIKPNHHELGELFGAEISTVEQAAYYGEKLRKEGAQNVLISMGSQGAVLVDEYGGKRHQKAPEGTLVSAVGSGDSMVAGFLAGWMERGSYEWALALGTAAGSATAFSEGLAERAMIVETCERLEHQVLLEP